MRQSSQDWSRLVEQCHVASWQSCLAVSCRACSVCHGSEVMACFVLFRLVRVSSVLAVKYGLSPGVDCPVLAVVESIASSWFVAACCEVFILS